MRKKKFRTFSEELQKQLKEIEQEELDRIVFKSVQRRIIRKKIYE